MTRGHVGREVASPARHGEVENGCECRPTNVYSCHVAAPESATTKFFSNLRATYKKYLLRIPHLDVELRLS